MSPTLAISDWRNQAWRGLGAALLLILLGGCATPPLQSARDHFYAGRLLQAEQELAVIPEDDKDTILYLMERGMISQSLQDYETSSQDWRKAVDKDELLETYSVSQGAASLLANDLVLSFRGEPFERTLLFAFLAKNYLAQHNWDYAAICARNIIRHLDNNDGFPDIPYGRYMAGFCLEMINDRGNAAIQYKTAAQLRPELLLEEKSGQLSFRDAPATLPIPARKDWPCELVCFVLIGRSPRGLHQAGSGLAMDKAPYAEIYHAQDYLGRSYPLDNTAQLIADTAQRTALIELAKTTTRLAVKVGVAQAVKQQSDSLGFFTELLLFSMERPDTRRWETLPLWLEVARLPCPANPEELKVIFKDGAQRTLGARELGRPLARRGKIYFTFCRDLFP